MFMLLQGHGHNNTSYIFAHLPHFTGFPLIHLAYNSCVNSCRHYSTLYVFIHKIRFEVSRITILFHLHRNTFTEVSNYPPSCFFATLVDFFDIQSGVLKHYLLPCSVKTNIYLWQATRRGINEHDGT